MFTLAKGSSVQTELVVKKSRFITTLLRADTVEEARAEISQIKAAFPDARHNCSAFVISQADGPVRTHSSDDGEPAGTAGAPMLDVLTGFELVDVVAVVTRYFGGILLGTGGLVRAYSDATRQAVQAAPLVELKTLSKVGLRLPLESAGRLQFEFHSRNWQVLETTWGNHFDVTLAVTSTEMEELEALVAEATRGGVSVQALGSVRVETPASTP